MNEGKPPVIDERVAWILEREFRNHRKVTVACRRAKISTDAFYDKLKVDQEFADRMAEARESPVADAEDVMFRKIRKGDGHLGFRFLQAVDPRYKPKVDVKDVTPPTKRVVVGNEKPHPMFRTAKPEAAQPPKKRKA